MSLSGYGSGARGCQCTSLQAGSTIFERTQPLLFFYEIKPDKLTATIGAAEKQSGEANGWAFHFCQSILALGVENRTVSYLFANDIQSPMIIITKRNK